jgi:hypothetical protein
MIEEGIPLFLDRSRWINGEPSPVPAQNKPLIYSYSMLNTYDDVCPHQFAHRYLYKSTPFVETPAMKWGNDVHTAFEFRIGGKKPLPVDMQKWEHFAKPFDSVPGVEVEKWRGLTQSGKGCESRDRAVFFRGKLDCTVVAGKNAYIVDFKSGSSKYEKAFELETSALLLQGAYPAITNIVGQYCWLAENRMGQKYDLSDTRKTWGKVTGIIEQIEHDLQLGDFEKKRSGLCGYCPVKLCEHNYDAKS